MYYNKDYKKPINIMELKTASLPPPPDLSDKLKKVIENKKIKKVEIKPLNLDSNTKLNFNKLNVALNVKVNNLKENFDLKKFKNTDILSSIKTFSLKDLDSMPILLSKPNISFPKSLIDRGIIKAKVMVEVIINEKGKVKFISFKSDTYEEIKEVAKDFAKRSLFTPPKKDGVKVKSKFIWPITFTKG